MFINYVHDHHGYLDMMDLVHMVNMVIDQAPPLIITGGVGGPPLPCRGAGARGAELRRGDVPSTLRSNCDDGLEWGSAPGLVSGCLSPGAGCCLGYRIPMILA